MVEAVSLPVIAALAVAAGVARPRLAVWAAALAAAAMTVILAVSWEAASLGVDLPWLPSVGSRAVLAVDALGAPLAVYAAGIAAPVLAYAAVYLPHHLHESERDLGARLPFAGMMLGFALSIILLMLAQDLLLIFLALELSALFSFLLIRFDEDRESRAAARVALVVTAGSSLLFLLGLVMVAAETGTTVLPELRESGAAAAIPDAAAVCMVAGVLGKSAQVPLHFWLPRAMTAPTPVSAYLHSAALVASGVFVLMRVRFLLEGAPWLLDGLFWFAFLSVAAGGLFALASDELKRVLAYSTIAQYGYAVALVAAGGTHGLVGAPFFILAHGLGKCALFMTAGAVTMTTGQDRLSASGGLARATPLLAGASFVAAAGVAGLPLTIGFFKDDLLLKAALEKGPVAAGLATGAIALTLAYLARFWFGIFGGRRREAPAAETGLVLPIAALAFLTVLGGVWTGPLETVFGAAASEIGGEPHEAHLSYPTGMTTELGLTLLAWAAGVAIWQARDLIAPALGGLGRIAERVGPSALARRAATDSRRLSDLLHGLEVRDARDRLTAVFLATSAIVLVGLIADGDWPRIGPFGADDLPLAAALVAAAAAAPIAVAPAGHMAFVLLLSFVGLSLALAFALAHAPDVALVLALVETMLTLLFLAVLSRMPAEVLARARRPPGSRRAAVVGTIGGVAGTATAWLALSVPPAENPKLDYVRLADVAHGKDVVTVILADFRGLDTAGEISVVVVAIFGAAAIWAGTKS